MSENPKRYWMSPAILRATSKTLPAKFPQSVKSMAIPTSSPPGAAFSRRQAFRLLAPSRPAAAARPHASAIPYVQQPEHLVPGRPYSTPPPASACEARCGLLVTTRDGRPLKIEGNPDHPLSGGATCAVGQASILGLYDGQRLAYPTRRGQRSTWADVDKEIATSLDRIRQQGGAVRILTPTITSPTTAALIARIPRRPSRMHDTSRYDPISASAVLDAHALTHGARTLPRYRFDRADVIVSLRCRFSWDVDFTCGVHARLYTSRRRIDERSPSMSYHVQIESRLSLTGSNADQRLRVAPGEIGHLATHLAVASARDARNAVRRGARAFSARSRRSTRSRERLWAARGRVW